MNYMAYHPVDVVNGEGTRCTLFVSGCSHKCKGCYNKKSWNPTHGEIFTKTHEDEIIRDLNDTDIPRAGLSLSGGDPLFEGNLDDVLRLVKRVKSETSKNVWLWSGYTMEELRATDDKRRLEILKYIDVFIDGKFEQANYDPDLRFRGSSNQIIHRFTLNN